MGHPDAELMRRWQRGDAAAVTALVDRWQQPVARFLLRLVGRPDRVPDMCQEVFLRLVRAAPRYRETGRFSTWLFQIALNVARDAGRQHRPVVELEEDSGRLRSRLASRLATGPEVCERRELADLVTRAVAELPPPLREVLALRHDRDMSFEEMARVLGVPASTLKSRFAAALNRLRDRLAELGWNSEETPP
jgi:RNA polymerase sigma-70 factor (ECF subfamily)